MKRVIEKHPELTLVNRRDVLLCLDAGIPAGAALDLCGFRVREQQPKEPAGRPRRAAPGPAKTAPAPTPVASREFPLFAAINATTELKEFEGEEPAQLGADFFSEDELRFRYGPPPIEPLMPLPRLWPYLHRVLGHRRPGRRLHASRVVRRAARGRPLEDLPRRPVLRWAPAARLVVDRTLPVGFLTEDLDLLLANLVGLRGKTGLRGVSRGRPPDGDDVLEPEDIAGLDAPPLPTLVLSDLGQLRKERPVMRAWLDFGRRLRDAGVTPVALVPCPRDRWDPDLTGVWRCAHWDRHAQLPAPEQGLEAIDDPEEPDKAARRAERLLSLLVAASLIEPGLLRALRCLLPPGEADIGSEFDVRVGGALAVAGHDMALLPQTRKACTERSAADTSPALKQRVTERVMNAHAGYGPQLWADEVARLKDWGAVIPPHELGDASDIRRRTNLTMLRDLEVPDVARRLGLFEQTRWAIEHLSKKALETEDAAMAWALLYRFDGREIADIPEGMNPEHVQKAMQRVLPDPGRVTRWDVRLKRGASGLDAIELRPWAPFRLPPDSLPVDDCAAGEPQALFHVRRPHVQLSVRRGESVAQHSLVLSPEQPLEFPVDSHAGISLRSDCGTLELAPVCPPPWATAFAWDQAGLYAELMIGETPFRLRWIPPGTFLRGSPDDEPGRYDYEGPRHRVRIDSGFWLGETPVTQAQYETVTGHNPSGFQHAGPTAPVEQVSWEEARAFCGRLGALLEVVGELEAGWAFRLPSEAEWEYACRAGAETALYTGPITLRGERDAPELDAIAWYGGNSGVEYEGGYDSSDWPQKQYKHKKAGTHPVGKKARNAFGLYDMLGNVWEWCEDHWHDDYDGAPEDGRAWVDAKARKGATRVVRGGGWLIGARDCRCAYRGWYEPGYRIGALGFRLVLAPSSTRASVPFP